MSESIPPAITTISQSFLTDSEPMSQLISALFDLLNDDAFSRITDYGEVHALKFVMDARFPTPSTIAGIMDSGN